MLYIAIYCYILLGPNNNAKSEFPRFPDGHKALNSFLLERRSPDEILNELFFFFRTTSSASSLLLAPTFGPAMDDATGSDEANAATSGDEETDDLTVISWYDMHYSLGSVLIYHPENSVNKNYPSMMLEIILLLYMKDPLILLLTSNISS